LRWLIDCIRPLAIVFHGGDAVRFANDQFEIDDVNGTLDIWAPVNAQPVTGIFRNRPVKLFTHCHFNGGRRKSAQEVSEAIDEMAAKIKGLPDVG
jgi:hypothetical protein